jgi:tetratricopeptide (TPR) repeat protein
MDSVLILSKIAQSLDNKLAEAYKLRGDYYSYKGAIQKAIDEYDHALSINPNFSDAYLGKGSIYQLDDYVKSIDNYQKASALNHGKELPDLLRTISMEYFSAGFSDKAKSFYAQALALDGDSSQYLDYLGFAEYIHFNYDKALKYMFRAYSMDTSNIDISYDIAYIYMFQNKFELSLKYFKNNIDTLNFHRSFVYAQLHHIGWALWENGQRKKAELFFNKQLEYSEGIIQQKRPWGQKLYPYFDIAGVYAFKGDKENAYKYLNLFNKRQTMPLWILIYLKDDPLFNKIRHEPAFQQIARDIEVKYQAEHERVGKWLEEQGML